MDAARTARVIISEKASSSANVFMAVKLAGIGGLSNDEETTFPRFRLSPQIFRRTQKSNRLDFDASLFLTITFGSALQFFCVITICDSLKILRSYFNGFVVISNRASIILNGAFSIATRII